MADLIDRQDLMDAIELDCDDDTVYMKDLFRLIKRQNAVDAEPVVHAHWIPLKDLDLCECSRCGRRELHYYGCEASAKPEEAFPYCHCGAKMDEEP